MFPSRRNNIIQSQHFEKLLFSNRGFELGSVAQSRVATLPAIPVSLPESPTQTLGEKTDFSKGRTEPGSVATLLAIPVSVLERVQPQHTFQREN